MNVLQQIKTLVSRGGEVRPPPSTIQTARAVQLHTEESEHPSRGLTPSKLAAIMDDAENGDLRAQAELAEEMEEKDAHLFAELSKRKRAILTYKWTIKAPEDNGNQQLAEEIEKWLRSTQEIEDLWLNLMDGLLKGYSCVEIQWGLLDDQSAWVPQAFHHAPASWFQTSRENKQELRLRDGSTADGSPLRPFGWLVHHHQGKSGVLTKQSLARTLAWPYMLKNFSVRDLYELLEIYGQPLRLGIHPESASNTEKSRLLRAVTQIGHTQAGIISERMDIRLLEQKAGGGADPFELMIDWCERSMSKAILGGTATSDVRPAGFGNSFANIHQDAFRQLTITDCRQIEQTINHQLIPMLLYLNGRNEDPRLMPKLRFDTEVREELDVVYQLMVLAKMGLPIPQSWIQKRFGIPEPVNGEPILTPPLQDTGPDTGPPEPTKREVPNGLLRIVSKAVARRQANAESVPDQQGDQLADQAERPVETMINRIEDILKDAGSLEEFRDRLVEAYPDLDGAALAEIMTEGLLAAQLAGRWDIMRAI